MYVEALDIGDHFYHIWAQLTGASNPASAGGRKCSWPEPDIEDVEA
jgi:hypothetical protein